MGKNNRDDKYTVFTEILPYLLELKKGQGGFFISIKADKNIDLFKYGIGCDKF